MVCGAHDAVDDAPGVECVKSKPLKKRCCSRAGGLSRYYSSKSQSFSSLDRVHCTPFGTSALALAKRPSSFDLQRYASGTGSFTCGNGAGSSPRAIAMPPRFHPSPSFRESSPEEADEEQEDSQERGSAAACGLAGGCAFAASAAMDASDASGGEEDADGGADRCPCNDTIFADPADAFVSPTPSPGTTPHMLYGSCGLSAAAAAAAAASSQQLQRLQLHHHHQQQLQLSLTSEYLTQLGALLPGQPLGPQPAASTGGAFCCDGDSGAATASAAAASRIERTTSGCSGCAGYVGPALGQSWPACPAMLTAAPYGGSAGGFVGVCSRVPGASDGGCGGLEFGVGAGAGSAEQSLATALPRGLHPSCSSEWNNNNSSGGCSGGGGAAAADSCGPSSSSSSWKRHIVSAGGGWPVDCSGGGAAAGLIGAGFPPAVTPLLPPAAPAAAACSGGGSGSGSRRQSALRHRHRHSHVHGHGIPTRGLAASKLWGSTENLIAALSLCDRKAAHPRAGPRRSEASPQPPSPGDECGLGGAPQSGPCALPPLPPQHQQLLQQQQQQQQEALGAYALAALPQGWSGSGMAGSEAAAFVSSGPVVCGPPHLLAAEASEQAAWGGRFNL